MHAFPKFLFAVGLTGLAASPAFSEPGDYKYEEPSGTYSIVAYDPETGDLGVGVQSNTIAVGSRVRWGQADVAAIASQASSNPMFGEIGVLLLQRGFTPQEALEMMVGMDDGALNRQFAIIDAEGETAAWTSPDISDWKGHYCGENFCAQGNTLTGPDVVVNMGDAFAEAEGTLAERIMAGLEAAEAAGGDRRGTMSAGIMIFRSQSIAGYGDWYLDLRVDESDAPIPELRRVLNARLAQDLAGGVGALVRDESYEEALALIDEVLELNPGRDAAYLQRADIYRLMGDDEAALEALATTVELNPKAFFQILRDDDFAVYHDNPEFLALGDASSFGPLPESAPEGITAE